MPAYNLKSELVYDNTGVIAVNTDTPTSTFGVVGGVLLGLWVRSDATPSWSDMDIRLQSLGPTGSQNFVQAGNGGNIGVNALAPGSGAWERFVYFGRGSVSGEEVFPEPLVLTALSRFSVRLTTDASGVTDRIRIWASHGALFG